MGGKRQSEWEKTWEEAERAASSSGGRGKTGSRKPASAGPELIDGENGPG